MVYDIDAARDRQMERGDRARVPSRYTDHSSRDRYGDRKNR